MSVCTTKTLKSSNLCQPIYSSKSIMKWVPIFATKLGSHGYGFKIYVVISEKSETLNHTHRPKCYNCLLKKAQWVTNQGAHGPHGGWPIISFFIFPFWKQGIHNQLCNGSLQNLIQMGVVSHHHSDPKTSSSNFSFESCAKKQSD